MQQVGQVISVLEAGALCFRNARQNLVEGMQYLHQIQANKLWEDKYSSFSEYVEGECQISRGYASKLISVWEHYIEQGGVSQEKLSDVDPEKLYLAIKLPQTTPEDQVVKARLWSRDEIKSELASKDGVDCVHPEIIQICASCHKRV